MKVFSKNLMLKRLEKEGRTSEIDEGALKIMDKLDDKPVEKNRFKALVFDVVEYGVIVDGVFYEVNLADCEEK